jgi:hypothetical protein
MTFVVSIPEAIIYKKVGEETVLLDFERGVYYGLDSTGAFVWELLAAGRSAAEIVDALLAEYDVSREEAARDVDALLEELESHGLIRR